MSISMAFTFTRVLRFISLLGASWSWDAISSEGITFMIGYLLFPVKIVVSFEYAHLNRRKKRVLLHLRANILK